jgi:hypothetical protein
LEALLTVTDVGERVVVKFTVVVPVAESSKIVVSPGIVFSR